MARIHVDGEMAGAVVVVVPELVVVFLQRVCYGVSVMLLANELALRPL